MTPQHSPMTFGLSLATLGLLITGGILYAGPLSPPVGPVTSTAKTLGEVEPRIAINQANTPGAPTSLFNITQPGSYYLTGNISVVGKHGINILASNVTIDLNGFELLGSTTTSGFDAVVCSIASQSNITVLNGSVRNWGRDGINLGDSPVTGCRVEGVRASGNARIGIYVGTSSQVSRCFGSGGEYGILTRGSSTVSECTATAATVGIYVESGSVVNQCAAFACQAFGIQALAGSSVTNCTAYNNENIGILVDRGGLVADCTLQDNLVCAIQCESHCVVRGNSCTENDGFSSTCILVGGESNRVENNSCARARYGIAVYGTGSGIGRKNIIIGNSCTDNNLVGGWGIRIFTGDNRIEGNICNNAEGGISVSGTRNVIVGNSCSNNSLNWSVNPGNYCLVVQGIPTNALINGNAGGVSPGSSDPNANSSF